MQQRDGGEDPARIECIAVDAPQAEVPLMPSGALYLTMTHPHNLDFVIETEVLRRA